MITAKTERFQLLRKQYNAYLKRICQKRPSANNGENMQQNKLTGRSKNNEELFQNGEPLQNVDFQQKTRFQQNLEFSQHSEHLRNPDFSQKEHLRYQESCGDHPNVIRSLFDDNNLEGISTDPMLKLNTSDKKLDPRLDPKLDILQKYFQSLNPLKSKEDILSSVKGEKRNEIGENLFNDIRRFDNNNTIYGSDAPNYANNIADDILNSIRNRNKQSSYFKDEYRDMWYKV